MDIVWYPCNDDAPALPVASAVCSLDWWVQERSLGIYAGYKVGEVPGAPRTYNAEKAKPFATGEHRCGTDQDFRDGAKFDAAINRPKRADGLPACCGVMPAGIVVGGRALVVNPGGGAVIGGRSRVLDIEPICGASEFLDITTMGPVAAGVSGGATSVDWILMTPVTAGRTYRFQLWCPTNTTFVRLGGPFCGAGPFNWFDDQTPGLAYYDVTQTIPVGATGFAYWEIFKTSSTVNAYTFSVVEM